MQEEPKKYYAVEIVKDDNPRRIKQDAWRLRIDVAAKTFDSEEACEKATCDFIQAAYGVQRIYRPRFDTDLPDGLNDVRSRIWYISAQQSSRLPLWAYIRVNQDGVKEQCYFTILDTKEKDLWS